MSLKYDNIHNFIDQYAPILKAFKVSALKILIAEIIIFEPNAYFYPQQMIQGWDNLKYETCFHPLGVAQPPEKMPIKKPAKC